MKIIAANWKLNGNLEMLRDLYQKMESVKTDNTVILFPPYTLLNTGLDIPKNLNLGAQDCSAHENGAFTGEVSAQMIANTGAKYVIVGHSERRRYHNESDELIAQKALIASANDLIPIICVGETMADKEAGRTLDVITTQVKNSVPHGLRDFIIAYEPIWAIGTGHIPSNQEIAHAHECIAALMPVPILYGGSVNAENAVQIMAIKNVAGALVGGASLKIDEFITIIKEC